MRFFWGAAPAPVSTLSMVPKFLSMFARLVVRAVPGFAGALGLVAVATAGRPATWIAGLLLVGLGLGLESLGWGRIVQERWRSIGTAVLAGALVAATTIAVTAAVHHQSPSPQIARR